MSCPTAACRVVARRRANRTIPGPGPAALFCDPWYGHTDCMRSIWKGSISFGLVNVPVKVYSATEDHDIKFHQVHAKDNGRIRYKRVCEGEGEVVEHRDMSRAYGSE